MKILVTGSAGFIGFHMVNKLIAQGFDVVGLDNFNSYYDVNLKKSRHQASLLKNANFFEIDICCQEDLINVFKKHHFDYVIHLAAQAGVRYSLLNPHAYIQSNIVGFLNILEACKEFNVKHLLYASSSSVYGLNKDMPFSVSHNVDHPVSLYAASKKSNELMAHTYSHLFSLPTTGLRFFTVYGPWGRPDMALFLFTKSIIEGKKIDVYNFGKMKRDFTYVDDITEGISKLMHVPPKGDSNWNPSKPDPSSSSNPYRVVNIGNNNPVYLEDFISEIERALQKKAIRNNLPIQPGDVEETFADISHLENLINFKPSTPLALGIKNFISWYNSYYN